MRFAATLNCGYLAASRYPAATARCGRKPPHSFYRYAFRKAPAKADNANPLILPQQAVTGTLPARLPSENDFTVKFQVGKLIRPKWPEAAFGFYAP